MWRLWESRFWSGPLFGKCNTCSSKGRQSLFLGRCESWGCVSSACRNFPVLGNLQYSRILGWNPWETRIATLEFGLSRLGMKHQLLKLAHRWEFHLNWTSEPRIGVKEGWEHKVRCSGGLSWVTCLWSCLPAQIFQWTRGNMLLEVALLGYLGCLCLFGATRKTPGRTE